MGTAEKPASLGMAAQFVNQFGLNLIRDTSRFMQRGGPLFNLVQVTDGQWVVILKITYPDPSVEPNYHAVLYDAPNGMIVDNHPESYNIKIGAKERTDPMAARTAFASPDLRASSRLRSCQSMR